MILADQYEVICLHFATAHGHDGYSVRPIVGTDWDMAEITQTGRSVASRDKEET